MAKKYLRLVGLHNILPDTDNTKEKIRTFATKLALAAKEKFNGQITYASLPDEEIDWEHFDITGVNLYKDATNRKKYPEELQRYKSHGKPVAITEYGTAPYKGAAKWGGAAHMVIDWQHGRLKRDMGFVPVLRDEKAQANYLEKLLKMYDEHEINAHFIFEYINWNTRHTPEDPKHNLSTGTFSLVHRTADDKKVRSEAYHRIQKILKSGGDVIDKMK